MKIEELIKEIKSSKINKDSALIRIVHSKTPLIYLKEFRDTKEYDFFHSLVQYGIFQEDNSKERYSLFSFNKNRLDALKNPEAYFKEFKILNLE